MQERTLETWEQFTNELERLYRDHASRQVPHAYISNLLFRGHGDSTWKLETTLERETAEHLSLDQYFRIIKRIQPKLETLSAVKWETPTVSKYVDWAKNQMPLSEGECPAVPYLAYLRHHGFPSPLLDWTRSPYVAAFFAFRNRVKDATHTAICVFLEWANSSKSGATGHPEIQGIGPNHAIHRRHFMQQSEYTVCTVHRDEVVYYASHESVFGRNDTDQDLLWKFNIPVSERAKVLMHLSKMNINAFSLFGSEDSLLEELATTEFVIRGSKRSLG
ncbi:MAG: FRG domain-containing protein [Candidatus Nitrotoga sp. MKT]|nr:MAG: FRG domain-containing protein [Candidatus Nitrotoga sp. MKT]